MIPVRVLVQAGLEEPAAKIRTTRVVRGCPLGATPLHQRQQISI